MQLPSGWYWADSYQDRAIRELSTFRMCVDYTESNPIVRDINNKDQYTWTVYIGDDILTEDDDILYFKTAVEAIEAADLHQCFQLMKDISRFSDATKAQARLMLAEWLARHENT